MPYELSKVHGKFPLFFKSSFVEIHILLTQLVDYSQNPSSEI